MHWGSYPKVPSICPGVQDGGTTARDFGNFGEMPESFSQRHNLAGPPAGTLLRDEVPPSFRIFLIDLPHAKVGIEIHEVHKVVCDVLQVWPDESLPPYYDYKRHIQACEWFRIYDIIEGLWRFINKRRSGIYSYANTFVTAINEALVEQNLGWQLSYDGKIVTRGDEAFERAITVAVQELINRLTTRARIAVELHKGRLLQSLKR